MTLPPGLRNKIAVATVSLGRHSSHTLERKIQAVAKYGFHGIELAHADLVHHAQAKNLSLVETAHEVNALCKAAGVEVLTLSPLKHFEGNLLDPLEPRLETAQEWVELAVAAGAGIVQMPSQFLPGQDAATGDGGVIIPELRALADMAAESGVSIGYEAVAFGRFQRTWQDALRIVEAVGRPNFGLCLDSFHVHSLLWADAYATTGRRENGDDELRRSMLEFLDRCPRDKVLWIQLSDASRFDPPLTDESPLFEGLEVHDANLAWSRCARPFPLEYPGYCPVVDIARVWILEFGWKGWVSLEGFLAETHLEANGPEAMAERAQISVGKLCAALGI
ncbi:putative 4-hydroxyphenylpyruvate dioxygenase [Rosellinia necatrix]|uniref:Putative 4-hydroxyphenylpyruvate dioxygenase n=1 Tax=Rosellinia necatrix TaxID=77044 RepID=A0A1S7UH91_ROSNE|nr:putative 4-hydroxyphenylpyruvate dioxygenase [Rosellinia necatrix]